MSWLTATSCSLIHLVIEKEVMFLDESQSDNHIAETTHNGSTAVVSTAKSLTVGSLENNDLLELGDLQLDPERRKEEAYEQALLDVARDEVAEMEYATDTWAESEQAERARTSRFVADQSSHVYRRIQEDLVIVENCAYADDVKTQRLLQGVLNRIFNAAADREEIMRLAAFIATKSIVMGTQVGLAQTPPERQVVRKLAKLVEYEAFRAAVREAHPLLHRYLAKHSLTDLPTGRSKDITIHFKEAAKQTKGSFIWKSFSDKEYLLLGNFLAQCVYNGCKTKRRPKPFKRDGIEYPNDSKNWPLLDEDGKHIYDFIFEPITVPSNGKREKAITLSWSGEKYIHEIIESVVDSTYINPPMLFPPKSWAHGLGGYEIRMPSPASDLIHNSAGTIPSETAVAALDALASIPWSINDYIYNIQQQLLKEHVEIGSFRTHVTEVYKIKTADDFYIDEDAAALPWRDETLTPDQIRERNLAYAIRKNWEKDEELSRIKAMPPQRVLQAIADLKEAFIDYGDSEDQPLPNRFYIPWFMDNRTRMYPLVDTLNPQGSDYQKALMTFYHGSPKSDDSYNDILISMATTYGNGQDKLSYEGRKDWAKKFVGKRVGDQSLIELMTDNPLSENYRPFWVEADEPFQFLALCKEYVDVFIRGTQDRHYVSSGRDATCSGIQITGSLLRDERTCELVNVLPPTKEPTPFDPPADAYGAVAAEAVALLTDDAWLAMQVEKREKNRELAAERKLKEYEQQKDKIEDLRPPRYEPWSLEDTKRSLPLDKIDRSVAKMVVMLTPYGGTFPTMLRHVRKKLEEKGCELHNADYTIITHALIAGMAKALRAFSEVNAWFKTLAKLTMKVRKDASNDITIEWITPNGSHVYQEYYKDDADQVRTSTNDAGIVRTYASKKRNIDRMNDRKMATALAANVVHSLDANIIQEAVVAYVEKFKSGRKGQMPGFTAVHDCIYGPSGTLSALTENIKMAFYNTTVTNNPLQTMLELNLPNPATRDELPILHQGKARISKAALKRSLYLFS
jgi:hypothetical protein